MKIVIDRFEEDIAVVEIDGRTFDLPLSIFPDDTEPGDIIDIKIDIKKSETAKKRKEIEKLMDELFED